MNFAPLLKALGRKITPANIIENYYQLVTPADRKGLTQKDITSILEEEATNLGLTQETAPFLADPQEAAKKWVVSNRPKQPKRPTKYNVPGLGYIRQTFNYVKR